MDNSLNPARFEFTFATAKGPNPEYIKVDAESLEEAARKALESHSYIALSAVEPL